MWPPALSWTSSQETVGAGGQTQPGRGPPNGGASGHQSFTLPPPRPELGPTAVGEMGGARGAAPELWSGASLHLWEGQEGQRGRTGPWTAEERPPGSLGWVASRRPGRRNRQWGLQGPRPEGQPVGPEGAGPGPEGAGAEGREGLPMGNKMTVPAPFSCSPVSQSRPHVPRAWRGGGAPEDTPQSGGWSRGGRAWSLLLR